PNLNLSHQKKRPNRVGGGSGAALVTISRWHRPLVCVLRPDSDDLEQYDHFVARLHPRKGIVLGQSAQKCAYVPKMPRF
ncbi:MAG: hypothetical protein ACPGFC_09255, partial [Paracoccaceae bacterium]